MLNTNLLSYKDLGIVLQTPKISYFVSKGEDKGVGFFFLNDTILILYIKMILVRWLFKWILLSCLFIMHQII